VRNRRDAHSTKAAVRNRSRGHDLGNDPLAGQLALTSTTLGEPRFACDNFLSGEGKCA
jgi:hypothetical protein